MSFACLWAKAFPIIYTFFSAPDIATVGTIFNVFSLDAVSGRDSNLSPARRRADALRIEPQSRVCEEIM